MAANDTPFYNSNYDDRYYTPYDDLDALMAQQRQQIAAQQGTSTPGAQFGGLAGKAAGTYAGQQVGLLGSEGTAAAPTTLGAEGAFATVGIPAAVVLASALGGRSGLNMLSGKQKNWKDASLADNAGRATLAIATGGISEGVNKFFGGHKSTKQRNQDRWSGLYNAGKVPDFFVSDPNVNQDMGVDDKKLASGKLGGRDVWATSGMFDTFGKNWDTTGTETQREQTAKKMLDEGLLDSTKGVTYVTNKDRAKSILDEILSQGKK